MKKKKMSFSQYIQAILVISAVVVGLTLVIYQFADTSSAKVDVKVPKLTQAAAKGGKAFATYCAQCHGKNASGSDLGPPLVHNIYNPGHHSDAAFYLAVKNGVGAHHWKFGNMPPQTAVSKAEVTSIIRYVRELQRANGISRQPHRM